MSKGDVFEGKVVIGTARTHPNTPWAPAGICWTPELTLADCDLNTLTSISNMAVLQQDMDDLKAHKTLYEEGLAVRRATLVGRKTLGDGRPLGSTDAARRDGDWEHRNAGGPSSTYPTFYRGVGFAAVG